MKLNRKYLQTLAFIAVYLYAIYFWSQPLQERKLPYGEYDAMSHFEIADYMAYNDKSLFRLPHYIDIRYGNDNDFKPHTLWYPPPFHTTLGIMEIAGGERVVPVFLMNAILATFILVTVYFVVNSLFGFLPAILSALLLIFSPRDFMPYLWGQWPERFAYAFIPIILYCFYKYFISHSKHESKPIYLYLTSILLGSQLLVHPLAFFHSAVTLAVLYIMLAAKQKKIVFNWKQVSIAALIFAIIFMIFPYQTFNVFSQFGKDTSGAKSQHVFDFSRLFQWSLNPKDYEGSVPPSYFSFSGMNGLWTLPFLLLGIAFLLWRREEKDFIMLAWLAGIYFILHRDLIGKASFLHRSLSATAHIFIPLTSIGIVYLASIIKLPSNYKIYVKYVLAAVFIYFAFTVNAAYASQIINKNTYNPNPVDGKLTYDFLKTLTGPQLETAQWTLNNVPASYNITVLGIPHQPNLLPATAYKIRWFAAASQHASRFYYLMDLNETAYHLKNDYILLDYSMLGPVNDRETFNSMKAFEKEMLANYSLLYDKNEMKVYRLEAKNH